MAVNLTWHSFVEQVWGIRLRCRTNCTCCETSELRLFRTQFWLVREPAAAIHKRHFAARTERLRQLGQCGDKCQPHTWEWGWKTQRRVSFCAPGGGQKEPDFLLQQHLLTLQHLLHARLEAIRGVHVQRSRPCLTASYGDTTWTNHTDTKNHSAYEKSRHNEQQAALLT